MSRARLKERFGHNIGESIEIGREPEAARVATREANPFQGLDRVRGAVMIPVDRIDRDPTQPREEFDLAPLAQLADSLRKQGQIQPIRVRWAAGRFVLIAGERRWKAAMLAGLPAVSAIVQEGEVDAGELLAIQLVENCVREDLKPIEQAKAFKRLMEYHGWTMRQAAEELGVAQSSISRAVALLELPEVVQDRVEQGALPADTAYEVSRLPREEQVAVADQVVAGKIRRDDLRSRARGKTRRREEFRIGEITWTVSGPTLDAARLRESLLEVLRRIDARAAG